MTTIGLDDLGTSTTLESNKSLHEKLEASTRVSGHTTRFPAQKANL